MPYPQMRIRLNAGRAPDRSARVKDLPFSKRNRFAEDASAKPETFLDRHLTDTSYLGRVAVQYLSAVCNPNRVWAVPSRLTGLLRAKWGLVDILGGGNVKNRDDHRHHAVDAFVIGMTSRSILQRISRAAGRAETADLSRLFDDMPPPFPRWDREAFKRRVQAIIVSHKPDHGHRGQMHNDTAYGLVGQGDDRAGPRQVVHRVPIESLIKADKIAAVRDPDIRAQLLTALAEAEAHKQPPAAMLAKFRDRTHIRHVRVLEKLKVIPITDSQGRPYKAYKGDSNFCFNIIVGADDRWQAVIESTFAAYQRLERQQGADTDSSSPAPLYRLWKDDLVAIDDPKEPKGRRILRVVKFSGNTLVTADHYEAGTLKSRDSDKDDPFKYLQKSVDWYRKHGLRPVRVNPLGKVHDPGSPNRRQRPAPTAQDD